MAKTIPEPIVVRAGQAPRALYDTLIERGRYEGVRRVRLLGGTQSLALFTSEALGPDEAVFTFRLTLDEPYEGPLALAFGHPDNLSLFADCEPLTLPKGNVEVEWHVAVAE